MAGLDRTLLPGTGPIGGPRVHFTGGGRKVTRAIGQPTSVMLSHWRTWVEDLDVVPEDFYSAVRTAVVRRQIPDTVFSRVAWPQRDLFPPGHTCLRIVLNEYIFDIRGAQFGGGFFVSWWLGKKRAGVLAWIPGLWRLFKRSTQPIVSQSFDADFMVQEAMRSAVQEAIESVSGNTPPRARVDSGPCDERTDDMAPASPRRL